MQERACKNVQINAPGTVTLFQKILQCGIGITRRLLRRTATTGCRQRSAPARARAVRRGYQPINFLVAPVRLLQRSTFF